MPRKNNKIKALFESDNTLTESFKKQAAREFKKAVRREVRRKLVTEKAKLYNKFKTKSAELMESMLIKQRAAITKSHKAKFKKIIAENKRLSRKANRYRNVLKETKKSLYNNLTEKVDQYAQYATNELLSESNRVNKRNAALKAKLNEAVRKNKVLKESLSSAKITLNKQNNMLSEAVKNPVSIFNQKYDYLRSGSFISDRPVVKLNENAKNKPVDPFVEICARNLDDDE